MSAREVGLETYFRDINRYPLLTKESERELAVKVQAGDPESRDQMVRSNLRLVVSIAKHYVDRGLPLLDQVEEREPAVHVVLRDAHHEPQVAADHEQDVVRSYRAVPRGYRAPFEPRQ